MGNKELCTSCRIYDALVPLKDGRNLCDFCMEDWLDELWEEYTLGDGGVELDI